MKGSAVFVASMAAASATAISSSSDFFANSKKIQQETQAQEDGENLSSRKSTAKDKFAPRFDGLRFIETLVTAHR